MCRARKRLYNRRVFERQGEGISGTALLEHYRISGERIATYGIEGSRNANAFLALTGAVA